MKKLAFVAILMLLPSPIFADCMSCHSMTLLKKTTEDGNEISLFVNYDEFKKSIHGKLRCSACHKNAVGAPHPSMNPLGSVREFKQSKGIVCKKCHSKVYKAYANSVHGKAVLLGNTKSPVCSDCHDSHSVRTGKEYNGIVGACRSCHTNNVEDHTEWLPNTQLHFNVVSCTACHTGEANKTLMLDENSEGRVKSPTVEDSHLIFDKSQAIKDCDFCHKSKNIEVVKDGAVVAKLNDIDKSGGEFEVDNIRNFLLDILWILALVGGIGVIVGHNLLKFIVKRISKK